MIILYMYLILLYIIIIFLLFLYNNNIEVQNGDKPNITLNFSYRITSNNDDDDINNFSLDISKNTKIKDILPQIYKKNKSIDIDSMRLEYNKILLNNNNALNYYIQLEENKLTDGAIINVKDKLYNNIDSIHYKDEDDEDDLEKKYKKYYKSVKKFTNINKHNTHHIKYSDKILKLFDNKSRPVLNSYNKNPYISKNKDKHIQGYLDDDDLLDNIIGKNNAYGNDDNNDKCCTKSKLYIENNKLVTDPKTYSMFDRVNHYENSNSTFKSYNYDYIDYMKEGKNKYKYLPYPTKLRTLKMSVD